MNKTLLASFLIASGCLSAWANEASLTPVGRWHNIDDKTGEIKSLIVIAEREGALYGYVEKLLRKDADPNARCKACTDERKDQPLVGLEIIRGAKKVEGKGVWQDGKILDPESGNSYNLRLTPIEGGQKLEVRGSIAFIGRTQTWVRVSP